MEMPNMADLFGKVNDMQQKMAELKQTLENERVTAEAGGGMVKVIANGNKRIINITLDKDIIDPNDIEMMEDLIVAGVNKAIVEAESLHNRKVQELTKSMIPGGMPGFDMSKFGL